MTVTELAKRTGVDATTIRRLVERGHLPAKRPPPRGYWRIKESDFEEIMQKLEDYGLAERAKESAESTK